MLLGLSSAGCEIPVGLAGSGLMNISGVVIRTFPRDIDTVWKALSAIEGVEVPCSFDHPGQWPRRLSLLSVTVVVTVLMSAEQIFYSLVGADFPRLISVMANVCSVVIVLMSVSQAL